MDDDLRTGPDLGRAGIAVDVSPDGRHLAAAATLEQQGYATFWLPGGQLDRLDRVTDVLRATTAARVATAIVSPDVYDADEVARFYAGTQAAAPGRFVLGLGGSQRSPRLRDLNSYLDRLDRAAVPPERRVLAALGPKKLALARDRGAGAITLLVTPEHTSGARAILGSGRTLVVDQYVVLGTDAGRARALARGPLGFLVTVPGYRASFARMGFTDEEITGLADRLVDELVAWGDLDAVTERIAAHRAAGADHVVVSILDPDDRLDVARRLATRLT
jgi:probable F420-dependent oxidoreductase